MGEKAGKQVS